jgi:hypothetical protein
MIALQADEAALLAEIGWMRFFRYNREAARGHK